MQALPVLSRKTVSDEELRNWPLNRLREIQIEMGKQCNVRCIMCYQTDFSPATRTAEIVWKERLLPAYEIAESLLISGGEPTILPGAKELLKTIASDYPHLKLYTVSNGVQFKGIWDETFLSQGGCVNFSLNAVDPALYSRIVQFGRYHDVVANIERLVAKKRETNSTLSIRISTVILNETIHELPEFIRWAAAHGLDEVLFYTDYLRGVTRHSPELVRKYLAEAYTAKDSYPELRVILLEDFDRIFARQHGLKPLRERPETERATKPCGIAFDSIAVRPDGNVFACCKSWHKFGNLIESDLLSVWNSDEAFSFRRRMLGMDFRDCSIACDLNAKPIHRRLADTRKAYAIFKRDPKSAVKKGLRRLGLSSAQVDLPEEMKPKALVQLSSLSNGASSGLTTNSENSAN